MTARSPKSKVELNQSAVALADQYQLVKHNSQLFAPVDWQNPVVESVPPAADQTVWLPMSQDDLLSFGNIHGGILFTNPSEFTNFVYMLMQEAARPTRPRTDEVFVKTAGGLQVLTPKGELVDPHGEFVPNMLTATLNPDPAVLEELWAILVDWLVEEEVVHSLLHHLATALAPGWSAGKLVMFIGKGANGKSTLLKMIYELLGSHNVSAVSRQQMAAREPAIIDLNNKLANIVFDAAAEYLKDSSVEKTLVVGEKVGVRMLYASTNTDVWTNGLFIEGQNEEPKTRDKSTALQRRLVRFHFPKKYALDYDFEKRMTSERMLGALLALLLDHYVQPHERAAKLAPSQASVDLQIEQLWANSKAFQWLHELVEKDHGNAARLIGMPSADLASQFHAWLLSGRDDYSQVDALRMLKEVFEIDRRSKRDGRTVKKVSVTINYTPDAQRMIDKLLEGGEEEDDGVLEDGPLVDD